MVAGAVSCPLCGAPSAPALTATDRNREISAERFAYRRCTACATVFLAEVPADLGRYYGGDYHGIPSPAELRHRAGLEAHKVARLRRHAAPGPLVEIGPSFGAFALAAREAGWDVTGIEMDPECCTHLESAVGVRAIESAEPAAVLPELGPQRAICLWHVLEHVPRPVELIRAAAGALEPGGVLAVAVPNPESLQFRALGARWAHLDAPRHLFLIAHATLGGHAAAAGLELLETTTTDPFGCHCNRFGWEYALRRHPARAPSGPALRRASQVLEKVAAPLERSGLRGAAYTVVLRRPA